MPIGIASGVPSLEEYFQKLSPKDFTPIRLPEQLTTSEGDLSLVAVGSQIPIWKFECALDVGDEMIKASGHSQDIEYSFEIERQQPGSQASPEYHFHFGLLPNPTAEAALWFSQFFYAMIADRRLIRVHLESRDVEFVLDLQLPREVQVDPLVQKLAGLIEFYQELIVIGSAFGISFRLPTRVTLQDRVVTRRVFEAINEGRWADCDTYTCDDSRAQLSHVNDREVDVVITEKDSIVQLFGHQLRLGPVFFIAPSALIHSLGCSQVKDGLKVEVNYRRFGACVYFLKYMRPVPGLLSAEELKKFFEKLSEQVEAVKLTCSEPGTLLLKEELREHLQIAKAGQARREAYERCLFGNQPVESNAVEVANEQPVAPKKCVEDAAQANARADERQARRRIYERACAFVSNRENAIRYAGQWVALDGDQVVAVGKHPSEVAAEAEKMGVPGPVVHFFPARDPEIVFWGGWQ